MGKTMHPCAAIIRLAAAHRTVISNLNSSGNHASLKALTEFINDEATHRVRANLIVFQRTVAPFAGIDSALRQVAAVVPPWLPFTDFRFGSTLFHMNAAICHRRVLNRE